MDFNVRIVDGHGYCTASHKHYECASLSATNLCHFKYPFSCHQASLDKLVLGAIYWMASTKVVFQHSGCLTAWHPLAQH
jgi:hypothetical protein